MADKAVVVYVDERSELEALARTQPSLPMTRGRAGTMTHDCKPNGTTSLLAHWTSRPLASIDHHLDVTNDHPKPLVWPATAESVPQKVCRGRVTLQTVNNQSAKTETHH